MRKVWLVVGALVAAPVLYNLDAITGQWKFDRMCKAEGGPRFYGVVEKDAGWEVDGGDGYDYRGPFQFGHVAFVRFRDKQGLLTDARAGDYIRAGVRQYFFSPADESNKVRYRLRYTAKIFDDDERFGRTDRQVLDIETGKILASYTTFGYEWTKPKRVILSAPTGVECWVEQAPFDQFYSGIYNYGEKK